MIHSAPAGVKAFARTAPAATRQIQFAFRADPVALDDLGLDTTARSTFVLILDNARSRGWRSRLSNATIGRILGRCPMTISRALGRLEAAGLVRRELAAQGRIRLAIQVTWEGVRREDLTGQASVRREDLTGSTRTSEGLGARAELTRATIQSEHQTGPILSMEGEDSEEAALFATLGPAKFLKAMIAKGQAEAAARSAVKSPPSPSASAAPTPETVVPPGRPAEASRAPQDEPGASPAPIPAPVADRPAGATPAASPATPRRVEPRPTPRTAVRSPSTSVPGPSTAPAASPTYPPAPMVPPDDVMAMVARMTRGLAEGLKAEDLVRRRVGPKRLAQQLAEVRRRHGRRG